ncbi:hypothetical protein MLD38_000848 [Melastoma candidum]|uniref:Uncharacterized protein n=1 Tax=Melastoma candidum TaxID=119954 RepID=A0ACB9SBG2_9MYRT|nr:hypothetical protein MLD38_000848 [Melastoma candidum]
MHGSRLNCGYPPQIPKAKVSLVLGGSAEDIRIALLKRFGVGEYVPQFKGQKSGATKTLKLHSAPPPFLQRSY